VDFSVIDYITLETIKTLKVRAWLAGPKRLILYPEQLTCHKIVVLEGDNGTFDVQFKTRVDGEELVVTTRDGITAKSLDRIVRFGTLSLG